MIPSLQDPDLVWLPISTVAEIYNRHPESIRRWCVNGFMIELGYMLRQDETGHWIVGVPRYIYTRITTNSTP
jgi:hypothetical protein